jgi:hypothetical protein
LLQHSRFVCEEGRNPKHRVGAVFDFTVDTGELYIAGTTIFYLNANNFLQAGRVSQPDFSPASSLSKADELTIVPCKG